MGSREEFNEMIKFIEKHQIKPIIDKSLLVRKSNSSTKPYGTWRTIRKYCTSNELKNMILQLVYLNEHVMYFKHEKIRTALL